MTSSGRINGFDALRTIAMWLGILLHAIIVYKLPPEPNWPQDETTGWPFLHFVYEYIHFFRMPLFFMVAGFFTRMVLLRSGVSYFVSQRFKRIAIPFILSIIILLPLSLLPFHYYKFHYEQGMPSAEALKAGIRQMMRWNGLAHLWFLYYLLMFYGAAVAYYYIKKKIGVSYPARLYDGAGKVSVVAVAFVTLLLFCLLYAFSAALPPVTTSIRPNIFYIAYYGFFFGCGWILQVNRQAISSFARYGWPLLILGTLSIIGLHWFSEGLGKTAVIGLAAVTTIGLAGGFTGIFVRHFTAESATWRYFSDAAYWVYLCHIIFLAGTQVLLLDSPVPGSLRLPIVLIVTFALSLASYHWLVRYTVIGKYLHGERKRPARS